VKGLVVTSTTKIVTKIVPALTARAHFGQILWRVKYNKERFIVEKRGEPEAVIISVEEYLAKCVESTPAASTATQGQAKAKQLDRLSLPESNLETGRTRRQGRSSAR
jgi:prevent-host-death family protein